MLDIGWTEIVVVAVVALVVLGPKELPRALKTFGAFMSKARSMAREFQSGVDEMIRESELDDLRKELQNATRLDFDDSKDRKIDPTSGRETATAAAELPAPEAEAEKVAAPAALSAPASGSSGGHPGSGDARTPAARPGAVSAAGTGGAANEDTPPFSAMDFDQDYPRATERQAGSEFLPPEAESGAADGGPGGGDAAERPGGVPARAAE